MDYIALFGIVFLMFLPLYLFSRFRVDERKIPCLVVTILFSVYVIGLWIEVGFLNHFISDVYGDFGTLKTLSIIQLPFVLIAWFLFYDRFIKNNTEE